MASAAPSFQGSGPRKAILDLSPLELDCMNTLWPLGEGTVREIQQQLANTRPRAYTTIMTIMDRLAHKGIVARQKSGRAYVYRPNLTAEEARAHAVDQLVGGFFGGSAAALAAHLAVGGNVVSEEMPRPRVLERTRMPALRRIHREGERPRKEQKTAEAAVPDRITSVSRLDDTLL